MPNIIEQQDLLKGLTDQRLAMLMQQPSEMIPPFLVAAEAQRRQAIRAQFGGGPQNNESVVDSLARQLAGTPQNVNANPPAPPAPPPQQMGIAGIQQPGMASGGPVRRFADGAVVAPPAFTGRFGAQYIGQPRDDYGVLGRVGNYIGSSLGTLTENMQKYGLNPNAAQREQLNANNQAAAASTAAAETPGLSPEENIRELSVLNQRLTRPRPPENSEAPKPPEEPRNPNTGTADTSDENKYKAQREDFRKRYEALLSGNEPSSWERAQKFFDASQAFFQPNATTGEMIADALGAFGSGMAQEKAAAREADRSLQEGLLNLDIQYAKEDRDAQVAAANRALDRAEKLQDVQSQREYDTAKARILGAEGGVREFGRQIDDIDAQLNGTGAYTGVILSDADRAALIEKRKDYLNRISTIMNQSGYGITPTREQIEEAIRTGK